MKKQKTKKWARRIIMTLLLSSVLLGSAPALLSHFSDADEYTAYAAETPKDCPDKNYEPNAANDECIIICPDNTDPKLKSTDGKQNCISATKTCPSDWIIVGSNDDIDQALCVPKAAAGAVIDDKSLLNAAKILLSIQKFLNTLIWPVLVMIGGLLDNSLLFGSGMEARLREIWIPIRNIVNILFVIVLVGIALYNVLGIGDENSNYSIKAILPKIIIGIIAVNFSFLGIKVFLDAINVLTVSIFSLPGQVNEELAKIVDAKEEKDKGTIMRFCLAMQDKSVSDNVTSEVLKTETDEDIKRALAMEYMAEYAPGDSYLTIDPNASIADVENKIDMLDTEHPNANIRTQFDKEFKKAKEGKICNGIELSPQGKVFLLRWNSRNAALAMALNMSKILFYQDIDFSAKTVEKMVINAIFSMLLYLIYAASFVALFIVLLARLVVLWLVIALSPVILLTMAVPVVKEKISGFGEITDKFVQNAIAPLGIALSMTVGWIMLNALGSVETLAEGTSSIDFGGATGIPVVGLNTVQDLIVCLGTVAVVWLGVFTAASKTIAAPVTEAMRGGLRKVGNFVGTMPFKHAAIIPIDVPGKPGERYTGEQVADYLYDVTDTSTKRGQLTRDMRGETVDTGPRWLAENGFTRDNVYKWINTNQGKLERLDRQYIQALEDQRARYPNIITKEAKRLRDIVVNGSLSDTKRKAAAEKLAKLTNYIGPIPQPEPETPKPKPTAAAGPTPPPEITGATEVTNKDGVKKQLKDMMPNIWKVEIPKLKKNIKDLADAAGKNEGNKVRKIIEKIRIGKGYATAQGLSDLLGKTAYENVLKVFDGKEANLVTYLRNRPKLPSTRGGGNPPPPTPPPSVDDLFKPPGRTMLPPDEE